MFFIFDFFSLNATPLRVVIKLYLVAFIVEFVLPQYSFIHGNAFCNVLDFYSWLGCKLLYLESIFYCSIQAKSWLEGTKKIYMGVKKFWTWFRSLYFNTEDLKPAFFDSVIPVWKRTWWIFPKLQIKYCISEKEYPWLIDEFITLLFSFSTFKH